LGAIDGTGDNSGCIGVYGVINEKYEIRSTKYETISNDENSNVQNVRF